MSFIYITWTAPASAFKNEGLRSINGAVSVVTSYPFLLRDFSVHYRVLLNQQCSFHSRLSVFPNNGFAWFIFSKRDCYRRRQFENPCFVQRSSLSLFIFSQKLCLERRKLTNVAVLLSVHTFVSSTQIQTQVSKTSASTMVMVHYGFLLTTTTFVQ